MTCGHKMDECNNCQALRSRLDITSNVRDSRHRFIKDRRQLESVLGPANLNWFDDMTRKRLQQRAVTPCPAVTMVTSSPVLTPMVTRLCEDLSADSTPDGSICSQSSVDGLLSGQAYFTSQDSWAKPTLGCSPKSVAGQEDTLSCESPLAGQEDTLLCESPLARSLGVNVDNSALSWTNSLATPPRDPSLEELEMDTSVTKSKDLARVLFSPGQSLDSTGDSVQPLDSTFEDDLPGSSVDINDLPVTVVDPSKDKHMANWRECFKNRRKKAKTDFNCVPKKCDVTSSEASFSTTKTIGASPKVTITNSIQDQMNLPLKPGDSVPSGTVTNGRVKDRNRPLFSKRVTVLHDEIDVQAMDPKEMSEQETAEVSLNMVTPENNTTEEGVCVPCTVTSDSSPNVTGVCTKSDSSVPSIASSPKFSQKISRKLAQNEKNKVSPLIKLETWRECSVDEALADFFDPPAAAVGRRRAPGKKRKSAELDTSDLDELDFGSVKCSTPKYNSFPQSILSSKKRTKRSCKKVRFSDSLDDSDATRKDVHEVGSFDKKINSSILKNMKSKNSPEKADEKEANFIMVMQTKCVSATSPSLDKIAEMKSENKHVSFQIPVINQESVSSSRPSQALCIKVESPVVHENADEMFSQVSPNALTEMCDVADSSKEFSHHIDSIKQAQTAENNANTNPTVSTSKTGELNKGRTLFSVSDTIHDNNVTRPVHNNQPIAEGMKSFCYQPMNKIAPACRKNVFCYKEEKTNVKGGLVRAITIDHIIKKKSNDVQDGPSAHQRNTGNNAKENCGADLDIHFPQNRIEPGAMPANSGHYYGSASHNVEGSLSSCRDSTVQKTNGTHSMASTVAECDELRHGPDTDFSPFISKEQESRRNRAEAAPPEAGARGFSCASGELIHTSASALSKAKKVFDDGNKPVAAKKLYSEIENRFQTSVSSACNKDLYESNDSKVQLNVGVASPSVQSEGFKCASGKAILLSDSSLKSAKDILSDKNLHKDGCKRKPATGESLPTGHSFLVQNLNRKPPLKESSLSSFYKPVQSQQLAPSKFITDQLNKVDPCDLLEGDLDFSEWCADMEEEEQTVNMLDICDNDKDVTDAANDNSNSEVVKHPLSDVKVVKHPSSDVKVVKHPLSGVKVVKHPLSDVKCDFQGFTTASGHIIALSDDNLNNAKNMMNDVGDGANICVGILGETENIMIDEKKQIIKQKMANIDQCINEVFSSVDSDTVKGRNLLLTKEKKSPIIEQTHKNENTSLEHNGVKAASGNNLKLSSNKHLQAKPTSLINQSSFQNKTNEMWEDKNISHADVGTDHMVNVNTEIKDIAVKPLTNDFIGFSTASGQKINIDENKLKLAESNLFERHDADLGMTSSTFKKSESSNIPQFTSASGKSLNVSTTDFKKAFKLMYESETDATTGNETASLNSETRNSANTANSMEIEKVIEMAEPYSNSFKGTTLMQELQNELKCDLLSEATIGDEFSVLKSLKEKKFQQAPLKMDFVHQSRSTLAISTERYDLSSKGAKRPESRNRDCSSVAKHLPNQKQPSTSRFPVGANVPKGFRAFKPPKLVRTIMKGDTPQITKVNAIGTNIASIDRIHAASEVSQFEMTNDENPQDKNIHVNEKVVIKSIVSDVISTKQNTSIVTNNVDGTILSTTDEHIVSKDVSFDAYQGIMSQMFSDDMEPSQVSSHASQKLPVQAINGSKDASNVSINKFSSEQNGKSFSIAATKSSDQIDTTTECASHSRNSFKDISDITMSESTGFSSASGKRFSVSSSALTKAKSLIFDEDLDNKTVPKIDKMSHSETVTEENNDIMKQKRNRQNDCILGQIFETTCQLSPNVKGDFVDNTCSMESGIVPPKYQVGPSGDNSGKNPACGFQTASGKTVDVTEESLRKARESLADAATEPELVIQNIDIDVQPSKTKIPKDTSLSLFQSTSVSKSTKVSDKALETETLNDNLVLLSDDVRNVAISDQPQSRSNMSPFQTASGQTVAVSENCLRVVKNRHGSIGELDRTETNHEAATDIETPESTINRRKITTGHNVCPFTTASGYGVNISEKALKVARETINDVCEPMFKGGQSEKDSVNVCPFRTASGCDVLVSEESLKYAKLKNERYDDISLLRTETSEETQSPFKSINTCQESKMKNDLIGCPFKTASGNSVNISDMALKLSRAVFEKEYGNESSDTSLNILNGSRQELESENENDYQANIPTEGNVDKYGFQTANGTEVQISRKSVDAARKMLDDDSSRSAINSDGFHIPVQDQSTSEQKNMPTDASSFGFQTASGTKVKISTKAVSAARKIFENTDDSSNCLSPVKNTLSMSSTTSSNNSTLEKCLSSEVKATHTKVPYLTAEHISANKVNATQLKNSAISRSLNGSNTKRQKAEPPPNSSSEVKTDHSTLLPLMTCKVLQRSASNKDLERTPTKGQPDVTVNDRLLESGVKQFGPPRKSMTATPEGTMTDRRTSSAQRLMPLYSRHLHKPSSRSQLADITATSSVSGMATPTKSSFQTPYKTTPSKVDTPTIDKPPGNPVTSMVKAPVFRSMIGKITNSDLSKEHAGVIGNPNTSYNQLSRQQKPCSRSGMPAIGAKKQPGLATEVIGKIVEVSTSSIEDEAKTNCHDNHVTELQKERLNKVQHCDSEGRKVASEGQIEINNSSFTEETLNIDECSQGDEETIFYLNLVDARRYQEEIIQSKKSEKIEPICGRLFEMKQRGRRWKLKDIVKPRYLEHNKVKSTDCVLVNSKTARDYKFSLQNYYGQQVAHVLVGDGAYLVPNDDGCAGKQEFYRGFLTMKGVDPVLISEAWLYNHYRWIVWKLAAYDVVSALAARCLTPENVMLQLKYRYDREIDLCHRSAVKKIYERDDAPSKRMVLCVSDIQRVPSPEDAGAMTGSKSDSVDSKVCIELTDGWYAIPALIDRPLTEAVVKGQITIGKKLCVSGAELIGGDDACSPLEAPESIMLKLNYNATRPAPWDWTLGYQLDPRPLCLAMAALSGDGGMAGVVDVVVVRKYQMMYMEKLPCGGCVFRTSREEERVCRQFQSRKQADMERLYARIEQDMAAAHKQEKGSLSSRRWATSDVEQLQSGQEIHDAITSSLQPDRIESLLTYQQIEMLLEHRRHVHDQRQQEINSRVQDAWADRDEGVKDRNVTPVLKFRVAGCSRQDIDGQISTILTIWRPAPELSDLKEGGRYKIYNVNTGASRSKYTGHGVQLTATKQTKFRLLDVDENFLDSLYEPREVLWVSDICRRRPPYGEVDFVGVVVRIDVNTYGENGRLVDSVYLCDCQGNLLTVRFWGGYTNFCEDIHEGKTIFCSNLMDKSTYRSRQLPSVEACSEFTQITNKPQNAEQRKALERLNIALKDKASFVESARSRLDDLLVHRQTHGGRPTAETIPMNRHGNDKDDGFTNNDSDFRTGRSTSINQPLRDRCNPTPAKLDMTPETPNFKAILKSDAKNVDNINNTCAVDSDSRETKSMASEVNNLQPNDAEKYKEIFEIPFDENETGKDGAMHDDSSRNRKVTDNLLESRTSKVLCSRKDEGSGNITINDQAVGLDDVDNIPVKSADTAANQPSSHHTICSTVSTGTPFQSRVATSALEQPLHEGSRSTPPVANVQRPRSVYKNRMSRLLSYGSPGCLSPLSSTSPRSVNKGFKPPAFNKK